MSVPLQVFVNNLEYMCIVNYISLKIHISFISCYDIGYQTVDVLFIIPTRSGWCVL